MSFILNEYIESPTQPSFQKKRHEHSKSQNIIYTDKASFDQKFTNFIESYHQNKKSVAIETDFDYTITSRLDYKTGKEYRSSYYLYDEDIIGGDQNSFDERRKALADKYAYEMVQRTKKELLLRRKAIEYLELLMALDITVIIESGGIGQFIQGYLKAVFPNFERYENEKKIIIVSNMFKFDEKTGGCMGLEHEVINCFNKADFLGNVVNKELPDLKYVMVLGDNLGDADSIKKINVPKENVIGFGFLNLAKEALNNENKKDYVQKKINESKKVFDVTLVGDCDYEPIIELLKNIRV